MLNKKRKQNETETKLYEPYLVFSQLTISTILILCTDSVVCSMSVILGYRKCLLAW